MHRLLSFCVFDFFLEQYSFFECSCLRIPDSIKLERERKGKCSSNARAPLHLMMSIREKSRYNNNNTSVVLAGDAQDLDIASCIPMSILKHFFIPKYIFFS